jgi:hypothetical protein
MMDINWGSELEWYGEKISDAPLKEIRLRFGMGSTHFRASIDWMNYLAFLSSILRNLE